MIGKYKITRAVPVVSPIPEIVDPNDQILLNSFFKPVAAGSSEVDEEGEDDPRGSIFFSFKKFKRFLIGIAAY